MYPITSAVKALFDAEQMQKLRITFTNTGSTYTASGAMASIDDAAAADAADISVAIEPLQSGSGDPSPENVRPISGWTGCDFYAMGANIVDGITMESGYYAANGTPTASNNLKRSADYIECEAGATYNIVLHTSSNGNRIRVHEYDANKTWLRQIYVSNTLPINTDATAEWEASADAAYFRFSVPNYSTLFCGKVNVHPTISFPSEAGTVYGGTLDVTTGVLTVRPYYASYNGETLVGPWVSSMDVYAEGVSPTTGAQVVDLGGETVDYQIDPVSVRLLHGANNLWANTGDTTVEYHPLVIITDANVMMNGFEIDRYCCNGTKLEIGTAIASELSLKLYNSNGQYNSIVFEGAELFVEVGIADWSQATPDITYIPCGYFICDHQPRHLNTIELKALDRMMLFDQPVGANDLTFPATVYNLVGQVCTLCGVTLGMSLSSLVNSNYSIPELPSLQQTITYRNLIQWCAGMMGSNAWMDWNGQLRFSWFGTPTNYTSTTANRFISDLYEDDIEITGVTYTGTDDTTVVAGTDDYALDLTGNYLVEAGASTIISNINTLVNGFTYRPFEATVINAPYLWPMDAITFTDKDGNDHTTVLTNVNFGLNGTTGLAGRGETAQTNSGTAPSAMTNEQKFMLEKFDASLDSQSVFDRLTDNGTIQGIYREDGQLYINASYIKSGTLVLGGANNVNGKLNVLNGDGNENGIWDEDGIYFERYDPEQYATVKTYICSPRTGTWIPFQTKTGTFDVQISPYIISITGNTYYDGAGRIRNVSINNYRIVLSDPDAGKSLTITADSAATKAELSLGTRTQNFVVAAGTLSASQLFRFMVTVDNDSSDLNGDRLSLYVNNDGLYLYNSTTGSGVWRLTLPVPVSQGGTGATTAPDALSNLGVKKKTITLTTSSSGSINANLDPTRYVVLSANSTGRICIPYKASNGTATYCKVLDTSMNPVANTEVTIDVTYLDLGAGAFS
jgi:hypothetical protein